jgi:hypothetical protein
LSTRAIEQTVRDAGLEISRSRSIVPLRQAILAEEAAGANVRFIPKGLTINTERLPEALTPLRRQFSYQVRITGVDQFGSPVLRRVTVSTDRRTLTPNDIEELAGELVSEEGQSDTLDQVEAQLEFGRRNPLPP